MLIRSIVLASVAFAASTATAQSSPLLERREVRADGHPLTVWSKRPPTPARGAVLLLHGRTWSARPNFDLQLPGKPVSLMDALVSRGYAVYALDQRGYGGTPRDASGWLTPDRADRDVAAVLDWVATRESRPLRPRLLALLGYSRGAMTAMLAAQRHPDKMDAVILYGFPYDVASAHVAAADPATPPRVRTTAVAAGEDFISPQATVPGLKEAYVRAALAADSVRVDWRQENEYDALDPRALRSPTLLLSGERDPYANAANLSAFFPRIATADRWWVVLPGVDHVAHLEAQDAFVNAVVDFLERRVTLPKR
jgi:alpha-beta hydrolase superfamily lysophospholipase